MKLGVVGLPNVGKSTLFNAITHAGAEAANYPFCTIEPNVGVVAVPDERLDKLAALYDSKKITSTVRRSWLAEVLSSLDVKNPPIRPISRPNTAPRTMALTIAIMMFFFVIVVVAPSCVTYFCSFWWYSREYQFYSRRSTRASPPTP